MAGSELRHFFGERIKYRPGGLLAVTVALSCLIIMGTYPAHAQSVPALTGEKTLDPSVLQKQAPDLSKPNQQTEPLSPGDEAKSKPQVENETSQTENAPDGDAGPKFLLREIQISGVTVFQNKVLEEKFTPWIDREVGYGELLKIAGDITNLYKDNGYVTSRAILPPQEIENGIVMIQVIEGRVGEIRVEGNKHVRDGYIAARVHQKPGEIFRLQTLQKDMLNLNGDTLFDKVHATLKTGSKPGTSDLVLDIDDHRPLHFMVGVDNMGRNGIGLWRNSYTLSSENVLGFGDTGTVNVSMASNMIAALGQYRVPLNTRGWGLGGNYSYTFVDAGETKSPVLVSTESKIRTITGKSQRFSLFTDFPIYRSPLSRRWDISGNFSLADIESMTYLDGISLKSIESHLKKLDPRSKMEKFPSLRTITSRVQVTEQDRQGRWMLGASMTNGIAGFGGNDAYVKFNGELTRLQALPFGIIGLLRAEGQFTPNRLPFAEKMQLGGNSSVRGYSEGYLIADAGYVLSAELRYPLFFLPKKIRGDWQGLVFADTGRLFAAGNNDVKNTLGRPGSLTGYGVGFRGRLTKYVSARIDLGISTVRNHSQPDLRAHFSLNSQLF